MYSFKKSVISSPGVGDDHPLDIQVTHTETAVFATDEPARNALAVDVLAVVESGVLIEVMRYLGLALAELTVEGFNLCGPELEVAHVSVFVAAERDFRWPVWKHVEDLPVFGMT